MILILSLLIIALVIFLISRLVANNKKGIAVLTIVALVIIVDQVLKFWIKTSYPYGRVMNLAGQEWAQLYFIENPGMAWGMELGGDWGKMLLTLFRLAAVTFGSWYMVRIVKQKYSTGFIICAALIYSGALGNLIDSMFYGMIFEESSYSQIAKAFPTGGGYGGFLHGKVVDMLYFPMIVTKDFTFFSPIFNIADASISVGVITLLISQLIFKKQFVPQNQKVKGPEDVSQQNISQEEAKNIA